LKMKIAIAQLNPTVGDVAANTEAIIEAIDLAREQGAELVVFSELAVCGYPPRDLLQVEGFVAGCAQAAKDIGEKHTDSIAIVLGTPLPVENEQGAANSLVVYQDNSFVGYYDKRLLPTYDVFDEDRYFAPGHEAKVLEINGTKVGLAICEDLWKGHDAGFSSHYQDEPDPVQELIDAGSELIVAPSASPYALGKDQRHRDIVIEHASRHSVPVVSVNQIGANDDQIFAGQSCVVDSDGNICTQCDAFEQQVLVVDTDTMSPSEFEPVADERMIVDALTLGIRDYLRKCGFKRACIGLSGGIDSALVAALAARALGSEHVVGASMPGRFSSEGSKTDAFDLAKNLGIECVSMPIEPGFEGLSAALNPAFEELGHATLGAKLPDLTQENLQSRIRGTMMMALSNRSGALVLTTGNKSEIAVGYCTLYGDMNGGLAVIADLPKTMVFKVCRYINKHWQSLGYEQMPIPVNTIEKPPSAELAPDQLDSDSLPEYEILDEIVLRHIELHQSAERIINETKIDPDVVRRFCTLIDRNEYKRQQMAVGLRVTSKAFGPGRRMPIAQRWMR
jgi:NAD+ synthase (glutamine-hydrolysing)